MLNKQYRSIMTARVKALKKTNATDKVVEAIMNKMFAYIDFINAQKADETDKVFGKDIDKVFIIDEFKDFILPKSVRFKAGNYLCQDLLIRPVLVGSDVTNFSLDDWINVQAEYRGLFKSDISSNITTLNNLRLEFSVSDIEARMAVNIHVEGTDNSILSCHYVGEPFIPIAINLLDQFYKLPYFNASADEVLADYVSSFR